MRTHDPNTPPPADDPLRGWTRGREARATARWARRHPRLTAIAGAVALLALLGSCHPGQSRGAPAAPARAGVAVPAAGVAAEVGAGLPPAPAAIVPALVPTVVPTVVPTAVPTAVPTVAPKLTAPAISPAAPVPTRPAGPTGGKCADYASQADAQAALRRDPVNAGRLDDDRDGVACESNRGPFDRVPVARPPAARS